MQKKKNQTLELLKKIRRPQPPNSKVISPKKGYYNRKKEKKIDR